VSKQCREAKIFLVPLLVPLLGSRRPREGNMPSRNRSLCEFDLSRNGSSVCESVLENNNLSLNNHSLTLQV
jgi:hypothetical protein